MKALPRPERGGSLNELRPIINTSEDANWIQFCGFLLAQFMPAGTMPVLTIQGPAGSGKSTAVKRVREVVDPSVSSARNAPRNAEDVMVAAKNNFLPSYDNISGSVSPRVSDALCVLATGGSMAKRANYTDFDEASMTAKRSSILSGIDELAERGDLADRSLILRLDRIEKTLSERKMNERFEQARPRVLGALLDAVSVSIKRLPEVQADQSRKSIRLMDMADWIRAGEPALPFAEGSFLKALEEEQAKQRIDIMEGNVLAETLSLLAVSLKPGEEIAEPAQQMYERLCEIAENESLPLDSSFPRSAKGLSQKLNRDLQDYELVAGLKITKDKNDRDAQRRRLIRVAKAPG